MFTSFDESAFKKAIEEKDYLRLKVNTVSTMLNDPTFERGETMEVLKILDEQVPDIFEEYKDLDYEERLERNAWDKRYFTKLTYWFQENFAKSRVDYIKEVGQAVHQDTAKKYAQSEKLRRKADPEKPTQHSLTKPNQYVQSAPKTAPTKPAIHTDKPEVPKVAPVAPCKKANKNFPIAGAILAVIALVTVGVLLIKAFVK